MCGTWSCSRRPASESRTTKANGANGSPCGVEVVTGHRDEPFPHVASMLQPSRLTVPSIHEVPRPKLRNAMVPQQPRHQSWVRHISKPLRMSMDNKMALGSSQASKSRTTAERTHRGPAGASSVAPVGSLRGHYAVTTLRSLRGHYTVTTRSLRSGHYAVTTRSLRGHYAVTTRSLRGYAVIMRSLRSLRGHYGRENAQLRSKRTI